MNKYRVTIHLVVETYAMDEAAAENVARSTAMRLATTPGLVRGAIEVGEASVV